MKSEINKVSKIDCSLDIYLNNLLFQFSLEVDQLKKTKVSDLEEINFKNERALIDQSELYKSKLVVEYERY